VRTELEEASVERNGSGAGTATRLAIDVVLPAVNTGLPVIDVGTPTVNADPVRLGAEPLE
jgi:hypothetical protein